jgi:predicted nuclease of predicted toxin-antitoxin system
LRFLLDENLSPLVGELIKGAGHDAVHVRDLGLTTASDHVILERARSEGRTLISADTDFGQLLAASGETQPSVILLRREGGQMRRAKPESSSQISIRSSPISRLERSSFSRRPESAFAGCR